jgi:hypothetical protein
MGGFHYHNSYDNRLHFNPILRELLETWMGPDLVYNPFVRKFTTNTRLLDLEEWAVCVMKSGIEPIGYPGFASRYVLRIQLREALQMLEPYAWSSWLK